MTEAMPFLRKLITFLWPPDIPAGFVFCQMVQASLAFLWGTAKGSPWTM